jgi:hypothetical protein
MGENEKVVCDCSCHGSCDINAHSLAKLRCLHVIAGEFDPKSPERPPEKRANIVEGESSSI